MSPLFQIADGLNGSCGGITPGHGADSTIETAVNMSATIVALCHSVSGLRSMAGVFQSLGRQCIALYLVGAAEWVIVAFSMWEYQVEKASERMDKTSLVENGHGGPPYWLRQGMGPQ